MGCEVLYCFLLAEGNASEGLYGAVAKDAEGIRHVHLVEREEAARVVDERRVGLAAAAREIEHAELAPQRKRRLVRGNCAADVPRQRLQARRCTFCVLLFSNSMLGRRDTLPESGWAGASC